MAELQLSVVSESESRRQIGAQIAAWEENLERLHCEQFRLRCYMASLQHGELPNPKVFLFFSFLHHFLLFKRNFVVSTHTQKDVIYSDLPLANLIESETIMRFSDCGG